MPITKSAKKALKVEHRRKGENDLIRAKIKGAVKGVRIGLRNGASDMAEKLQAAYRELDLAAKKNVIHKNKAARLKSRLSQAAGTGTIVTAVKKTKKAAAKTKAVKKRTTKK